MKYKLNFLFLLFFMLSCNNTRGTTDKISDHILCQFAKQMKKKGLITIGSGGGCTIDKKINDISMTFEYKKVMNVNEARELLVESVQTLLNLINNNPENKLYFDQFPVSIEIIVISILSELCATDPECVEAVSIIKGQIYYDVNHPIPQVAPYLTLKEESFEEAQKIVSSKILYKK